ncbi:(2Fe-2S)-binding protein [Streptomyces radicis]|uniref:(2Fe-2S)-binding protein n=1 Tax=Streptomyces radicis TaxID=1750517 RepID=A0A3A9W3G7_9ACTN|nr:(2Fe-2S)-binding protein [Streptomyces radicis]RKN06963.1 (2Fe-2S)-binding protein [Streptomyces radicis]RKN15897.1 (2Fe-2S)-binding protein [Streptomyces radicis]
MTVPVLAPTTPLTSAFTRITEVVPSLRISEEAPRRGDGWLGGDELAAGGAALDTLLAWDDESIAADYGQRARPDVVAGFALHRYAWPVAVLFTAPHFLLRRVPLLAPGDVSFHRGERRMTVRPGAFACLADDPAVDHPGARPVADEEALRATVRRAAADHLGPVLAAFGPRMRRGPRALWGTATDELVEALWYVGSLLGEEERAVAEAGQLLPGAVTPFARGASFRELTGPEGEALRTRDRASCCMFYTLRPEDTCVTCPRTCDGERITRLAAS